MWRLSIGSFGVLSVLMVGEAFACKFSYTSFPTGNGATGVAPAQIEGVTFSVDQGAAEDGVRDSCDDIGNIRLVIPIPADADTPPEDIGYEVRVEDESQLPANSRLPIGVTEGQRESADSPVAIVRLRWLKDDPYEKDRLDFAVRLVAVDRDGNRSEVSEPIRIQDADNSGCSVSPAGIAAPSSLLDFSPLVLLAMRRRRRTRVKISADPLSQDRYRCTSGCP